MRSENKVSAWINVEHLLRTRILIDSTNHLLHPFTNVSITFLPNCKFVTCVTWPNLVCRRTLWRRSHRDTAERHGVLTVTPPGAAFKTWTSSDATFRRRRRRVWWRSDADAARRDVKTLTPPGGGVTAFRYRRHRKRRRPSPRLDVQTLTPPHTAIQTQTPLDVTAFRRGRRARHLVPGPRRDHVGRFRWCHQPTSPASSPAVQAPATNPTHQAQSSAKHFRLPCRFLPNFPTVLLHWLSAKFWLVLDR